jgi:hypothetical protein
MPSGSRKGSTMSAQTHPSPSDVNAVMDILADLLSGVARPSLPARNEHRDGQNWGKRIAEDGVDRARGRYFCSVSSAPGVWMAVVRRQRAIHEVCSPRPNSALTRERLNESDPPTGRLRPALRMYGMGVSSIVAPQNRIRDHRVCSASFHVKPNPPRCPFHCLAPRIEEVESDRPRACPHATWLRALCRTSNLRSRHCVG